MGGRGQATCHATWKIRKPAGPMRPSRFLLFLAALGLWSALPTAAQISPGPLSRAHQSLSGTSNCTTCHKLGGEATFKCVACHTEIGNRVTARKGLHSSYNLSPGSSQECVRCHSEHNGEDFPLIKWDIRTFDHKQTGYALEGKHVGVACNRCHSAQHIAPQVACEKCHTPGPDSKPRYAGIAFGKCSDCHSDPHRGSFTLPVCAGSNRPPYMVLILI